MKVLDRMVAAHRDHDPALLTEVGDFSGWFGSDALDTLIATRGLRHPTFLVLRGGQVVHPHQVCVPTLTWGQGEVHMLARPDAVFGLIATGHSVLLDEVQRLWSPLAELTRGLTQRLHGPCAARAVYTPAGQQTPALQRSDRISFVVQVEGGQSAQLSAPPVAEGVPGECAFEANLRAGDVLYVPRGLDCVGRTLDTPSLQLQLSCAPVLWGEVLRRALERHDDPLLDAAVGFDVRRDIELSDDEDEAFDEMLERFAEVASPALELDR